MYAPYPPTQYIIIKLLQPCNHTDIEKIYRDAEKDLYDEGLYDIFIALASKYLNKLRKIKQTVVNVDKSEYNSTKVVEYLKLADEKSRMNEYTWLVKGFFEIVHGESRCCISVAISILVIGATMKLVDLHLISMNTMGIFL